MRYYPNMDWPPLSLPKKTIARTLAYSDNFDYPLTLEELWFWQIGTDLPRSRLAVWPHTTSGFYHLKNRSSLAKIRSTRSRTSLPKIQKAIRISRLIRLIPSVRAIFVTGSLAMRNSAADDDIDIMLVVSPYTLWISRFIVVALLMLAGLRRPSRFVGHSSPRVRDKICDNLYLDLNYLHIPHLPISQSRINQSANLYLAHEILQAESIFDRGGVRRQFLVSNSWTKKYLPVAYREILKHCNHITPKQSKPPAVVKIILFTFNLFFFILQYIYMRPHLTSEKIGLGYAFFHPRNPPEDF